MQWVRQAELGGRLSWECPEMKACRVKNNKRERRRRREEGREGEGEKGKTTKKKSNCNNFGKGQSQSQRHDPRLVSHRHPATVGPGWPLLWF